MSIHSLCKPRPSVHAADRRATVLNLDTFLKGEVNGSDFFEGIRGGDLAFEKGVEGQHGRAPICGMN